MAKIDLTINEERLKHAIARAKERNIVIPTLEQQLHPETVPAKFKKELESIGLAVPEVSAVMSDLRRLGMNVREDVLTVEEAVREILRATGR